MIYCCKKIERRSVRRYDYQEAMIYKEEKLNNACIRKATLADLSQISDCAVKAFSIYVERIGREPAPMIADFETQLRKGYIYVISDETEIFGYVVFWTQSNHLHLESLAVDPQYKGYGLGKRLIMFVENQAKEWGHKSVELCTNLKMYENLEMYPRLGYHETGRRIEDGYNRVYFRKEL